jgi:hypothetical protein
VRVLLSGGRKLPWRAAALAAAAAVVLPGVAGCAKMDQALSQQWIVVDFTPTTSVTTALQVRAACAHIQNTPPMVLPAKHTVLDVMYGIRFDTTNSSPANVAELETCLQRFKSVQGLDPEDTGDEGG